MEKSLWGRTRTWIYTSGIFIALCSSLFKVPKLCALSFCIQYPIELSYNSWGNLIAEIESLLLLFQIIFHSPFHVFAITYTTL